MATNNGDTAARAREAVEYMTRKNKPNLIVEEIEALLCNRNIDDPLFTVEESGDVLFTTEGRKQLLGILAQSKPLLALVPEQGMVWHSLRINGKHIWRFDRKELDSGLERRVAEINAELAVHSAAPVEEAAEEFTRWHEVNPKALPSAVMLKLCSILRQHGYGAQPRLQIIEVREVKPSHAPDRHVVFLNNREIASFEYEHEAQAFKANLETALAAQGQGVGPRKPDGYAYRYPDGTVRFSGGRDVNGSSAIESIPYYFGEFAASPVPSPESATKEGK